MGSDGLSRLCAVVTISGGRESAKTVGSERATTQPTAIITARCDEFAATHYPLAFEFSFFWVPEVVKS